MELVYVTVIAAIIGAGMRYLLPGHRAYGLFLLPAVAAAVTATVWVGLVWLGFTFDGGWIWAISLASGVVVALLSALLLVRYRAASDEQLLQRLSGGRA